MSTVERLSESEYNALSKKQLIEWIQHHASNDFLKEHKLKGAVKNVAKGPKEKFDEAYEELFKTGSFRTAEDDAKLEAELASKIEAKAKLDEKQTPGAAAAQTAAPAKSAAVPKEPEKKLYHKQTIKKGDKHNYPLKGEQVTVRYKGTLPDGTVFDTNMGKKDQPLRFKVGMGQVIRGWDEGIMEMSVGEKAKLTIQPEWAYGKEGVPGRIPPNTVLTFEVILEACK